MSKLRTTFHQGICFLVSGMMLALLLLSAPSRLVAQTATGSIVGTVTDPSGAVVPGVTVTIKSTTTGLTETRSTTATGTYSVLSLEPGEYTVSFRAKGFRSAEMKINLPVGVVANGDFKLELGSETQMVTVESAGAELVSTVQATVQDVMTSKQIDALPLNGRNFLDLAQLNPGIQIQDGGNFDPTKNGFTGISAQGRSGRSTRIEMDGIDISDETVGTTTINISEDSIQEFQVAQSTLDPATSLTSSGAVNIITRPGGNTVHGSGFTYFRGNHFAARVGRTDAPFDRQQYGTQVGGPFKTDKLFWFANWERTVQDGTTFTNPPGAFSDFAGHFPSPFHETEATGRLDWNVTSNWRAFYSIHHDQLNGVTGFGGNVLAPFHNRNLADVHAAALDGTTGGRLTHSFRYGYMRFRNDIGDARAQVPGIPFGASPFLAAIGGGDILCLGGTADLCAGPNFLAPQFTLQRNMEFRYDGSYLARSHTFRYGAEYVRIPEAVFANFVGLGPILYSNDASSEQTQAAAGPFPGGVSNPLNYPLEVATFGNGLGWFSELPGLGHPHGATNARRYSFYIGDIWKLKPNFTINLALRYNRDTGRTNSDLPGLAALEPLLPGTASRHTHQPDLNFAPQLGIAWDPFKNGKTSIRAGIGLFYDNFIFNSSLFDRTLRIPAGIGNVVLPTTGGVLPGTNVDVTSLFGQPIGSVADQAVAAQVAFQAANTAAAQNFNPKGTPGFADPNVFDFNSFNSYLDPSYHTPYSTQINAGVQRQIRASLFVSVDYLHNGNVHSALTHDLNLVGAARTLNVAAAQAAIAATETAFGCSTIDCTIANEATIFDFANNGLGSPTSGLNGQFGAPNSGFAFAGRNPNFGAVGVISMIGRSNYNALQFRIRQNVDHPFRGVRHMTWMANYSLSRFNAMSPDQDFLANAVDNISLMRYMGPNNLDRTHMVTFASTIDLPAGWRVSWLSRVNTALPTTLRLPFACSCPAEIFLTDLTGDGSGHDVLPGTQLGAFGRSVKLDALSKVIANFNSATARGLTPASQALVAAGLFTSDQLKALGASVPSITPAPAGQVALDSFTADDIRVSWRLRPARYVHRINESLIIEPTMDIFNVFNIANYDPPNGSTTSTLSGILDGTPGSVNGTSQEQRTNRYGLGSGVFSVGLPRSFQFGVRATF